ncbi:hypothetical protein B0H13DRAFT_1870423 [Mycena leptocephala]|nr:hypothetical protein B0H13DRAFT_1870423 [Mycena leptocephala]
MNLLTITLLTATLLLQLRPILAQDPCDSTCNPLIYAAIEAAQLEIKAVFHSSHISSNLRPLSHEIAREWDQWCYQSMGSRKVRLLAYVAYPTVKFASTGDSAEIRHFRAPVLNLQTGRIIESRLDPQLHGSRAFFFEISFRPTELISRTDPHWNMEGDRQSLVLCVPVFQRVLHRRTAGISEYAYAT